MCLRGRQCLNRYIWELSFSHWTTINLWASTSLWSLTPFDHVRWYTGLMHDFEIAASVYYMCRHIIKHIIKHISMHKAVMNDWKLRNVKNVSIDVSVSVITSSQRAEMVLTDMRRTMVFAIFSIWNFMQRNGWSYLSYSNAVTRTKFLCIEPKWQMWRLLCCGSHQWVQWNMAWQWLRLRY